MQKCWNNNRHATLKSQNGKTMLMWISDLRLDTTVTENPIFTSTPPRISKIEEKVFLKKRPSHASVSNKKHFKVQTSVYLSNFMSRFIKMVGIPCGMTKGHVCFFLFCHLTCFALSGTLAWNEEWRHSWNSSLWTFPQHFLWLNHCSLLSLTD